MTDLANDHATASKGFLSVVENVDDWSGPTPCTEWNARGVLEHVLGEHDVLVLGPAGRVPERLSDDPAERWAATIEAMREVLSDPAVLDQEVEVPGMGKTTIGGLAPILTTDVLVHSWDLAKGTGQDVTLDPALCEVAFERAKAWGEGLAASGMFSPPVEVPDDAPVQDRMLGLMGRDPNWQAPS